MESIISSNSSKDASSSELSTDYLTTTESARKHISSDFLLKRYIVIIVPSVFLCIFLIVMFIILIRKIIHSNHFNPRQLETYASVNYEDETVDEDLESSGDFMYSSCRLLVGEGYENNAEVTNSEPEYDCMSVDVTVSAKESSIVDWGINGQSPDASQETNQTLNTLPHDFWKH